MSLTRIFYALLFLTLSPALSSAKDIESTIHAASIALPDDRAQFLRAWTLVRGQYSLSDATFSKRDSVGADAGIYRIDASVIDVIDDDTLLCSGSYTEVKKGGGLFFGNKTFVVHKSAHGLATTEHLRTPGRIGSVTKVSGISYREFFTGEAPKSEEIVDDKTSQSAFIASLKAGQKFIVTEKVTTKCSTCSGYGKLRDPARPLALDRTKICPDCKNGSTTVTKVSTIVWE